MSVQGLYGCFAQGSSSTTEVTELSLHKQFNFCCKFVHLLCMTKFKTVIGYGSFVAMPRISVTESTLNPCIGESFFLECTVVAGIPKPTVVWIKDEIPLNESSLPVVSLSSSAYSSRIQVSRASAEYNGMYTCVASNDAGSVSESFLVKLQGQLAIIHICSYS